MGGENQKAWKNFGTLKCVGSLWANKAELSCLSGYMHNTLSKTMSNDRKIMIRGQTRPIYCT